MLAVIVGDVFWFAFWAGAGAIVGVGIVLLILFIIIAFIAWRLDS